MKLSCIQENLSKGLSLAAHIAGKEASLPILSHVLLSAENGILKVSATNLELGINCYVRGKIEQEGVIALDARVVSDYVSLLPKEIVTCETQEEDTLRITCQNYDTTMRGVNSEDFPIIPSLEKEYSIFVKVSDFKRAIQSTVFATQYNESRPELSGIFINVKKDESLLYMVATDAYRLAERAIPLASPADRDVRVIVPLKTMQEVLRILPEDETAQVEFSVSENQILFIVEGIELISKIVIGEYPDYTQIIPSNWVTRSVIETKEFTKAVKVSSIFSKKGLNDVLLEFTPTEGTKGELSVASSNSTIGENKVVLPVEMHGGENRVVLNHRYLLDGLAQMEGDKVSLGVIDADTACILKSPTQEHYLYLIMPIRQ